MAKGRLVATGDRVLLFDVKTGKLLHAWPDSGKSLDGYGRGLLAGDLIYWPTKNEIQVLDQHSGLPAEPPIKLQDTYHTQGGNLAAGDGYLIVAQTDGLVVFCQNSRLIERYRDAIVRAPDDASNYFRLAKAAEALGRDGDALESYRDAAHKAKSNETIDGVSLAAAARDHLFRLLLRLAAVGRRAHRWQETVDRLESAYLAARSDPERLQSQLLLADVLDRGRPPERCRRHLRASLERRSAAPSGRRDSRWASHHPGRSLHHRPPPLDRAHSWPGGLRILRRRGRCDVRTGKKAQDPRTARFGLPQDTRSHESSPSALRAGGDLPDIGPSNRSDPCLQTPA